MSTSSNDNNNDNLKVLQKWCQDNRLSEVTLNSDGTTLQLQPAVASSSSSSGTGDDDNVSPTLLLQADSKVTISVDGDKSCTYSLASLFLQIQNPQITLPQYRLACKKYKVNDPVKATEKSLVLTYFQVVEEQAAAAATTSSATTATAAAKSSSVTKEKQDTVSKHSSSSKRHREKDHHKSSSSSSKRSRHSSSTSTLATSSKMKKAPKQIDPNALFTNLTDVVTKRTTAGSGVAGFEGGVGDGGSGSGGVQQDNNVQKKKNMELYTALSSTGFDVITTQLLDKYKETMTALSNNEIPVGNSASILKASAEKDLSPVLKLYIDTMSSSSSSSNKHSSSSSNKYQQGSSSLSSSSSTTKSKKIWRQHLIGQKPIIVLPKGMTSPITLVNGYEFFKNSTFIPRDVLMKRPGFNKNKITTTFTRRVGQRLGGGTVEYELIDNPKNKLRTARDWDRVVAVVALGHGWQFKDWPDVYSNPVHLFGKTFGFYVGMEGAKVPTELQGWSVVQQKLNRDKRGLDSVTYASFWNGLDEFMAIHKPEMLPQEEY